ncbi:MAG: mechanosensitive ion channel family protein [Gemmatimonadales bacterium]
MQADTAHFNLHGEVSNVWRTINHLVGGFFGLLPKLVLAILLLAFVWLVARGIRALVQRVVPGPRDSSLGLVLGRLSYAGIWLIGVFLAISIVAPGVGLADLIGLLGIGGVAIGFAFKDIFQNLLAGILILLRQPFRTGDEITAGSFTGTVESIETRATFIRTYDGKRVIVPNSQIYTEPVTVITAHEKIRSEYDVGIGYGDDISEAKRIALEAVRGIEGVLEDPAPDALTWDLADFTVNIRVRWWSEPTRGRVVQARDRVLQAVKERLSAAGIDLPFPTQQLLVHDQTESTDGDRRRQREGWPKGDNPPDPRRSA